MIHFHRLDGCAPVPLAYYLKALGILRLVVEQADPSARGWWHGDEFRLATVLDRQNLEKFFLERYQPTALVAPWNKGSGFFQDNDPGLTPVARSTAVRFTLIRDGIVASRSLLSDLLSADSSVRAIKAESKAKDLSDPEKAALKKSADYKRRLADSERAFKAGKAGFIPRCRLAWRGSHREWMDAAMVLDDDGKPHFPALLGTGGNDGRLDFTNNFMQRLGEVFDLADAWGRPRPDAKPWIAGALWQEVTAGYQDGSPVGQYMPGAAGGANSSNGPDGDSLLNPFDFLLMMEGSILFSASSTRRLTNSAASRAAAPFVVNAQGAGYFSASEFDESARGEQWMPLWVQPLTLMELRHLLAEGRAQVGARAIREPLDLARAVARLGVARGISEFQRYGYVERNGQSNLAVPLGRFRVPEQIVPRLACLDDLDVWLPRLRRETRDKTAPSRLQQVERRLSDALFAVTEHPNEPTRWQSLLLSLTAVEGVQVTGSGYRAGPVPSLRSEWVTAADDGSAAFRLALSCALQTSGLGGLGRTSADSVRRHWLPLDGQRFATNGTGQQIRLDTRAEVVLDGRDGVSDAIALVARRLIEASQDGERRLPLVAARFTSAVPADLSLLLAGQVDIDRTMALARALMAVNAWSWREGPQSVAHPTGGDWPDDAWLVIRLAMLPFPLRDGRHIAVDPSIVRRLESGDASGAFGQALRRLRAAGINVTIRTASVDLAAARLWAAALVFPINRMTAERFVKRLDPAASTEQRGVTP
jgi:CRISPR-associated protein Csx17